MTEFDKWWMVWRSEHSKCDVGTAVIAVRDFLTAEAEQRAKERDKQLLLAKELGVIEHVKGGWSDGCQCEPCIYVRQVAAEARRDESEAMLTHPFESCMDARDPVRCRCCDRVAANRLAALSASGQVAGPLDLCLSVDNRKDLPYHCDAHGYTRTPCPHWVIRNGQAEAKQP
jgi:hypothetical protein